MPTGHWETPTGAVDGVNLIHFVSKPYVPGSVAVSVDIPLRADYDDGWIESNPLTGEVTMKEAPNPGETIRIWYLDFTTDVVETTPISGTLVVSPAELEGILVDSTIMISGMVVTTALLAGNISIVGINGVIEDKQLIGTLEDKTPIMCIC